MKHLVSKVYGDTNTFLLLAVSLVYTEESQLFSAVDCGSGQRSG